jgi:hypothetical protein
VAKTSLSRRGVRIALVALFMTVGGAGVAYATGAISTGSDDPIVGCAKDTNGQLRIVDDASQCLASEHSVAFQAPVAHGPQNLLVDCTAGESINQAIENARQSEPVTIAIKGTCTEAVIIDRDGVSLQAQSPGDGIRAPSSNDSALSLNGATHVNLGQLTLTGGRNGLGAFDGASFSAFNLHVTGATTGVMIGGGSSGDLNQATIENSAQDGLGVNNGGSVQMNGGTITDSGGDGVSLDGGHASLGGVTVTRSGFQGVSARDGSTASLGNTTVEHSVRTGVHAFNGGSISIANGSLIQFNGQVGVIAHSASVNLQGAHVANNEGAGVGTFAGGRLNIQGGTVIENNHGDGVQLFGGGAGSLQGPNVIRGNSGNGIHVRDTSIAIFDFPSGTNQIVDNGGWGLFCDGPPAVAQASGVPGTLSPNSGGTSNCPTN